MFRKILVPLDGSELAELALPYAQELAGAFQSEVTLVHVCEPVETQYRHMHQLYVEKMAGMMGNRIKRVIPEARVKPVILDGEPVAGITNYARDNDIGLIVAATHGRSGVMLWAMGSIAQKVIERSATAVLLIRAKTPAPKPGKGLFRRILVPLDGSSNGGAVLPYVEELARQFPSEVVFLQVVVPGQWTHTVGGLNYVRFTEDQLERAREQAVDYLNEARARLSGTKVVTRAEIRIGDTAQEIIKCADEMGASLVAMSSHGRSGTSRWVFGAVAHKVLHAGIKPLLLVRAPGAKE